MPRIWEEKCRARWPSLLPIISHTRYFSIPLFSPIFLFSRRFNTDGASAEERGVKWFDWAFSMSFLKLSCGPLSLLPACRIILFFLEDQTQCSCRPGLKRILHGSGAWQHDSVRSRWISKLCKMKLFLSITAGCKQHSLQNKRYRFFAFCKLARRRAQSMGTAPSASHCATGWALKKITLFYRLVNDKRQERSFWSQVVLSTAVPTCRAKWLGATSRYSSSTTRFQTARSCRAVYMT